MSGNGGDNYFHCHIPNLLIESIKETAYLLKGWGKSEII